MQLLRKQTALHLFTVVYHCFLLCLGAYGSVILSFPWISAHSSKCSSCNCFIDIKRSCGVFKIVRILIWDFDQELCVIAKPWPNCFPAFRLHRWVIYSFWTLKWSACYATASDASLELAEQLAMQQCDSDHDCHLLINIHGVSTFHITAPPLYGVHESVSQLWLRWAVADPGKQDWVGQCAARSAGGKF